jgi:uncharacterized protein (TIGR01777 family)
MFTIIVEEAMKVVIPGGTGHLGTLLARGLSASGHEIALVTRRPGPGQWREVSWDGLAGEIDGSDIVINLAGRSVNCRYNATNRREILDSRVVTTRAVGDAIANARVPPRVWLQASTATIYSHRFDAPNDELTGQLGGQEPDAPETWRFSIDVATAWEGAANEIATPRTRKVLMRTAIVMSPGRGGTFDLLYRLVRFGLGGPAAGGRQFVSWIHGADFVAAVRWLIGSTLEGAVNIASPEPLPYRDFIGRLREAAGIPVGLPATRWMLEAGAFALRTETELILKSRRVMPRRLLDAGFVFQFPSWPDACIDLVAKIRDA